MLTAQHSPSSASSSAVQAHAAMHGLFRRQARFTPAWRSPQFRTRHGNLDRERAGGPVSDRGTSRAAFVCQTGARMQFTICRWDKVAPTEGSPPRRPSGSRQAGAPASPSRAASAAAGHGVPDMTDSWAFLPDFCKWRHAANRSDALTAHGRRGRSAPTRCAPFSPRCPGFAGTRRSDRAGRPQRPPPRRQGAWPPRTEAPAP